SLMLYLPLSILLPFFSVSPCLRGANPNANPRRYLDGQAHQVVVDQEEAGEAVMADQRQLLAEALAGLGVHPCLLVRIALRQQLPAESLQRLIRRFAAPAAAEVREGVAEVVGDVEGLAALGDEQCIRCRLRQGVEALRHQLRFLQVELA